MEINLDIPLTQIITDNPFKVTFPEEDVESIILDEIKIQDSINEVKEDLSYKLPSAKISNILLKQLAIHRINGYEKYAGEFHQYHYPTLIETLRLHNNGGAVNERSFKGSKLKHFKHIHHNSNTFVVKNLENYWKLKYRGKNEIEYQNELLNERFKELLTKLPEEEARKKVLSVFLIELMNESQNRNFNNKTGEWIIFTVINGSNVYLCLATHEETKLYSDEIVLERIRPCLSDYPILESLFRS